MDALCIIHSSLYKEGFISDMPLILNTAYNLMQLYAVFHNPFA
jgi:hypothetical protein